MSTSTRNLSILLFPNTNEALNDLRAPLGSFLKKAKEQLEIVLAHREDDLAELSDLELKSCLLESSESLSAQIETARDACSNEDILLLDYSSVENLNSIYQWWLRKQSDEAKGLLKITHRAEKAKAKTPWKNRMQALAYNIFTPSSDGDLVNRFLLIQKGRWIELSAKLPSKAKNYPAYKEGLLNANHLLGFQSGQEELEFSSLRPSSGGFIASFIPALIQGLRLKWDWFVRYPLKHYKETDGGAWSRKSPIWRFCFLMLAFLVMLIMPALSFSFGILWDEPDHISYADDVLRYFSTLGENTAVIDDEKRIYFAMRIYGIFFDTFSAFVYHVLSPFGIYETRHLLNALVGAFGMLYAGLLGRQLGGWRAGFLAFLIIFLSPYYFGHSMNNHKDIPFATGYIMAVYYLLLYLKQLPKPRPSTVLFLIVGIASVISIRVGGLLVTAYVGMFTGIFWLIYIYQNSFSKAVKLVPRFFVLVTIIAVASFILGILPWPYALEDPLNNPFVALQSFTNFELLTIYEVFNGERIYMNDVPWNYLPKLILITSPFFALVGWVLSLFLWYKNDGRYKFWSIAVVLFTIIFPVVYAVYKDSTLYNGWRHFLFIYPALAALAALGWDKAMSSPKKWANYAWTGLFGLLCLNIVVWEVRNHPNQYCYFNETVGGYAGAYGKYELDSYGNAMRQGIEWLIEHENLGEDTVKVGVNMTPPTAAYYASKTSDKIRVSWLRDFERMTKPISYAIFAPRTFSPTELLNGSFPPEGTIGTIDVEGKPLLAIVKFENDFMYQGYVQSNSGNYLAAIPFFQKAVDYDPDWEEGLRMLGTCLLNAGRTDEAGEYLLKAVEINPDSYMAWGVLGVYYARKNDYNRAVESLVRAVETKVNNSGAYLQLASLYETTNNYYLATPKILTRMGQYLIENNQNERAVKMLNVSKNKDSDYAETYQQLALVYAKLGQGDQMNKANRKYKKLTGRETKVKDEIDKMRQEQEGEES